MKAIKFIENRDKLSNEISKYWNIISKQNVLPKMLKRTHDLKKLYTEINNLADQRALVKLKLIAINMGYKKFSDLPAELNQYDVFKLCELNEIKVKLQRIPILNPTLKAKKGKKALTKSEELTSNWIKARIQEIDIKIIKLQEKLTKFNEEAEFDDSEAPLTLAA
jgi:hypothetical protein